VTLIVKLHELSRIRFEFYLFNLQSQALITELIVDTTSVTFMRKNIFLGLWRDES